MSDWFYKRINWFAGCLAVAALFGLVVFAANIEIKDTDLWLHLATGKHILQTLSIPRIDFFSCTIPNTSWNDHEWLFQVIVSLFYENAGIQGLINLRVGVVLLSFVLLLFLGYTRERQFIPVALSLLVLLVYQGRMTLRPDIFSLLFFALYIAILGMHLGKRWSLWAMVLIQMIWVNMHGFFIFGPALILIGVICEWIKRRVRLPLEWNTIGRLSDEEYRRLKLALPVVVLVCFVNPYFIEGVLYPFKVLFAIGGEERIFFNYIQELQRPFGWGDLLAWHPYFHYRILIIISFLSFILNRRKIDINALLLWVILLLFSLAASRNVVFFAFAAYFVILANFQYVSMSEYLPPRWDNEKFKALSETVLKVFLIMWIVHYGDQLLLRGYYDFDKFERKSEYGGLSQRNFPHKAADFLVANGIKGNFFNDFNSGAYLIGRASPDIKVFIDGRTEVYGGAFFKTYQKIWKGDAELFDEAAVKYHLTGAFLNSVYVPAPQEIIRRLYDDPDWALVYFDYDAAIFLKDIPFNRPWIDRYQINISQWQTNEAELMRIGTHKVIPYRHVNRAYALFHMGFPGKAEAEAYEALRIEPYNAQATQLLGKIYNERGDFAKGFENLRKAKLLQPNNMAIRYQIALALYHLGNLSLAEEQCQRVLSRRPQDREAMELMALIKAKAAQRKVHDD